MTVPVDGSRELLLPRAASLMLWAAACHRGDIGPDDAAILALGARRTGMDAAGEDLFDWLTSLRRIPLPRLRLLLPRPGRIAGLVGPPAAITEAISAGQAVLVAAADLADHTLIPHERVELGIGPDGEPGPVVRWHRHPAPLGRSVLPADGTGREHLVHALRRAASSSLDWDLVPEEPIEDVRAPHGWAPALLPAYLEPTLVSQLILAARTMILVEDELVAGNPQAVTLAEKDLRRDMLEDMRDAAVAALIDSTDRAAAEAMLG
ncbi:hypothetical protein [Brachybacterium timonense]|uniref:hypothetical protein n=1 Tax=Brachybacterium timonense TaxID=2050896 RepID=UPI000D0BC82C|nr:hypothetical protein [Brachybacterium timonense]